jgi:hypothetical protein
LQLRQLFDEKNTANILLSFGQGCHDDDHVDDDIAGQDKDEICDGLMIAQGSRNIILELRTSVRIEAAQKNQLLARQQERSEKLRTTTNGNSLSSNNTSGVNEMFGNNGGVESSNSSISSETTSSSSNHSRGNNCGSVSSSSASSSSQSRSPSASSRSSSSGGPSNMENTDGDSEEIDDEMMSDTLQSLPHWENGAETGSSTNKNSESFR